MAGTDSTLPDGDRTLVQPVPAGSDTTTSGSPASGSSAPRHAAPPTAREAVAVQRASFGGIHWGAAFFGWLSANGLAVLLIAVLGADEAAAQAETIGLGGAIAALVVLFVAYLAGGYVAGRMARFDGVRQGVAVWVIGLVVVLVLAAAGVIAGAEYNVLQELDLPRIPVDEGTATTGALITLGAVLLATLLAAMLGGKLGDRYHRKVDRAGFPA
jgi:MFS family permease